MYRLLIFRMQFISSIMYRVRLLVSYDGTDYSGWQKQKNTPLTFQGLLEEKLSKIFNEEIHVVGAGRTDAGVHARAQIAHFDCSKNPEDYKIGYALQGMTPTCFEVKKAWIVPHDFHSISSAREKTYKFYIFNNLIPCPFRSRYQLWIKDPLSLKKLNEDSQALIGEHDFKSFQASGASVKTTVRKIHGATWKLSDTNTFELTIRGNGFLKQMVRNIFGTLLLMHRNNLSETHLLDVINAMDRKFAGPTAPPHGLFLHEVIYPESLEKQCKDLPTH